MTNCTYFPICSGCSYWDTPYSQQITSKILYLQSLLKENNLHTENSPEFISCGEYGLRHRVDFTIEFNEELQRHTSGFYDLNKNLIHIDHCLQLAPELQDCYSEFIQFRFFYKSLPVRKGSIRLRVGPEGLKGCWLDFSNLDIKHLLEDQTVLIELLDAGYFVEVGQKGKQLIRHNGILKLAEPVPNYWIKTVDMAGQHLELKCLISDFTQPSWISAEALVKQVLSWSLKLKTIKSVLEFGPGVGQFTLSFLNAGLAVDAFEINESAANQLMNNAKLHKLENKLAVHVGDFHKKKIPDGGKYDLIFVNPARSGLKNFADEILKENSEYLIYISCFPESMITDLTKLSTGYSLCNIIIVDQFPQTKHFEICVLLKKLN